MTSVEYLKDDDFSNTNLTLEHWKNSFRYRQHKLSNYTNFDEVLSDWPAVKMNDGYILVILF